MASVDVPVALLGYGTVGTAVSRLLAENADDIERATGHRLRVVRALVRDPDRTRAFAPEPGVMTTDFASIRDDPSIAIVAEVMGGIEPARGYVLDLLRAGKPVVTANKQLIAQRSDELFPAASAAGVQLRFEASVCAAIPVIKVLREALVVSNVHRVLGIVNGTTNFILTRMEAGTSYDEALREAQHLGFAEADPTDDVSGADAAAKMAILATIAFGSRVTLADVAYEGIEGIGAEHIRAAQEMSMVVRLIGEASLIDGAVDVRVHPALVDRHHPLAAVEGAFNAVMLQGDAIREITLEGPGAGGVETASAVIADMVSVVGTTGTGFLQDDAAWRKLERLAPGALESSFYIRIDVDDRPGSARPRGRMPGCPPRLCRTSRAARDGAGGDPAHRDARGCNRRRRVRARGDRGSARDARHPEQADRDRRPRHLMGATLSVIARYADRLPVDSGAPVVSLGEGSTPLIPAPRVSKRLGIEVLLKLESANPTGSFKDRGMTVAVSKALADGARAVICASTGNTAASAAAYAARAGLIAVILQPAGAVALGKLMQARAVGARVLEVRGSFDQALAAAIELGNRGTHVLVNSVNPYRLEGQKTAAFEIAEELGGVPDIVGLPYGGGGNTVAYARGFDEWGAGMPRLVIGEAAQRATTVASAIRIAEPVHQDQAETAVRSLGWADRLASRRGRSSCLARARDQRGSVLRALERGRARGPRADSARAGAARRLRHHRARPEGPCDRGALDATGDSR